MKKLILLFFPIFFLSGCSSNDEPESFLIDPDNFSLLDTWWAYSYESEDANMKKYIWFSDGLGGAQFTVTNLDEGSGTWIGYNYSSSIQSDRSVKVTMIKNIPGYNEINPTRINCTFRYKGKMTAIHEYSGGRKDTLEYVQEIW